MPIIDDVLLQNLIYAVNFSLEMLGGLDELLLVNLGRRVFILSQLKHPVHVSILKCFSFKLRALLLHRLKVH